MGLRYFEDTDVENRKVLVAVSGGLDRFIFVEASRTGSPGIPGDQTTTRLVSARPA